jgi:predicted Kef-type K+ transport protein
VGVLWIAAAFLCGLLAKRLRQEPILGFLVAGFGMEFAGLTGGTGMPAVAEVGVQLLLFTIGLKLDLRSLLRPHV